MHTRYRGKGIASNNMVNQKRSREEYYYAPIPIELIKIIDEVAQTDDARKYGLVTRPKVLTAILADFVELYEKVGAEKCLVIIREMIRHADEYK